MRLGRFPLSLLVALALVLGALPTGSNAADGRSEAVVDQAVVWLVSQQQDDGGFEVAGFPGFETPDVVLAFAEASVTPHSLVYDPIRARGMVAAITENGRSALDYLDDFAEGDIDAGQAAKFVLVADALALDPTAFDPQGDGAVDLFAIIDAGRQPDGSYGFFNATLQVLIAFDAIGRPAPSDTVGLVVNAQQANGGWNFEGDAQGTDEDVDTTSRALQALVASGLGPAHDAVRRGYEFLAARQNADGSWSAFGAPDPNATAMAILAVAAAGYDVQSRCWRDVFAPARAGGPYVSPDAWLRSQEVRQEPNGSRIASPSDSFGVNTFATSQAVQALMRTYQPTTELAPQACPATGYRLVATDGGVFAFGSAAAPAASAGRLAVDIAATPSGDGHWLFKANGAVAVSGDAVGYGDASRDPLNQPIVAGAPTPTGGGYWLFAADGGVFTFGDAPFLGSLGHLRLNQPIVAGSSTPTGEGYWLFAADGGVFAFGDAPFLGSMGATPLNQPVVAGAASRTGSGYRLFAADGGVFTFGDAAFHGSMGAVPLNQPVTGGASTPGDGYWMVAADGGVFTFGDAPFLGAATGRSDAAIVAIAG